MGQELWLAEKQLPTMSSLGVQFVARSGMEEAVSTGILRGRPFGGTSIAWSADLDHAIKPLVNYKHKRVVCVELQSSPSPIILASIYMPYFNSSKREESILDTIDAISMLELVLDDHPLHKFVIGGDFNTELRGDSPFDNLWTNFISKYDMKSCDDLVSDGNIGYTYIHNSLNHKKWNDHFLMSSSLVPSTSHHKILDDGDNLSDHLPIMMQFSTSLFPSPTKDAPVARQPSLKWDKCNEEQKARYANALSYSLINSPCHLPICLKCHCENSICKSAMQAEYDSLISKMKVADKLLPRHKPGVAKGWWTDELEELKQKNIEIHEIWKSEGRPGSGPTYIERLRVRTAYRKAIKKARTAPKQKTWDKLHEHMADNDTDGFWKSWKRLYSKQGSHLHTVVNGTSSKRDIADSFKDHFMKVSKPNDQQRVNELQEKFISEYRDLENDHPNNCKCDSYQITFQSMIDSIFSMKAGKSADDDGLTAEHYFNAPLILLQRLHLLLNTMLRHGFVPTQFRFGTIVPIVKDHHGDLGDIDNYRGITLSPIASKIFEHCLRMVFSKFLTTSHFQFGFKKKSSTTHALFTLKETINYYVDRGSNVFCSFLDASKAFDRLVHAGLFIKLMKRETPLIFLKLVIYWYNELYCRVRWDGDYSEWFRLLAGVRQGGILSPDFYSIYVDELVYKLSKLRVGCHIRDIFISALLYADDMALISPSLKGLQKMLTVCERYCNDWDICLNPKKSKNLYFGKRRGNLCKLKLNGAEIEWTDKWTYLGVDLVSHTRFNCCIESKIRKFYRCANSIFRVEGKSNDLLMLELVESHCISILTYGIEVISVANRDKRRQLRVAYNSVFRRIFGYRRFQSVRELQSCLGRPTWEELLDRRVKKFEAGMRINNFLNSIFPR